jgi:hypothetical protein
MSEFNEKLSSQAGDMLAKKLFDERDASLGSLLSMYDQTQLTHMYLTQAELAKICKMAFEMGLTAEKS